MSIFSPSVQKKKEKKTEQATSTTKLPEYINQGSQQAVDLASQQAAKPFTPYTGERQAGFSPEQEAASANLAQFMNGGAAGGSVLDDIYGHSTADYMNPYTKDIMDIVMGQLDQGREIAQNQLGLQAHGADAFGDSRHGVESGLINQDWLKQRGEQATKINFDAFNAAMGLKSGDLERFIQGGKDRAAAAGQLFNMGGARQATAQGGLDKNYEMYLREQGYPEEMIKLLSNTVSGVPTDKTTDTSGTSNTITKSPGPSMFQTLADPVAKAIGTAVGTAAGKPPTPAR